MSIVVEHLTTGALQTNTYFVHNIGAGETILFDPAGSGDEILAFLRDKELTLKQILLTHGHCDHIEALDVVRDATGAPAAIHELDAPMLTDASKNLSAVFMPMEMRAAERTLTDGEEFDAAGMHITCLHTPGHTRGGMCYLIGDVMLSGDTLFYGTIGRTDFPGSDGRAMAGSIAKLAALEGDYKVYPGHGGSTTLDYEKRNNGFFTGRMQIR